MIRDTVITLLFGLIGSIILLLPSIEYYYDIAIPFVDGPVQIAAIGGEYMRVFFHEIGHSVFFLLYGYLSVPTFDVTYGGGFAYALTDQMYFLMLCVTCVLVYTARLNHENKGWMRFFILLTLFQLGTGFIEFHYVVILFMGHGSELLIGSYMLWRALMDMAPRGIAERWANALFGFYFVFANGRDFYGLMTNSLEQAVYIQQKGGLHLGDFSQIGMDYLHLSISQLSLFALLCALLALCIPFILYFRSDSK